MNAANQAQGLAALGRYGDTTLVHMNPAEVKGLAALAAAAGKELTINPETGLPEAFGLKEILMGLAIGAAAFTGGASLAGLAAAAPAAGGLGLGATASGALGTLGGATIGAGLNAAKGAATGSDNVGRDALFGAASGALSGLGGSIGALGDAAGATSSAGAVADPTSKVSSGAVATDPLTKLPVSPGNPAASAAGSSLPNSPILPQSPAGIAGLDTAGSGAASAAAPSASTGAAAPTDAATSAGIKGLEVPKMDSPPELSSLQKDLMVDVSDPTSTHGAGNAWNNMIANPGSKLNMAMGMGQLGLMGIEDTEKQLDQTKAQNEEAANQDYESYLGNAKKFGVAMPMDKAAYNRMKTPTGYLGMPQMAAHGGLMSPTPAFPHSPGMSYGGTIQQVQGVTPTHAGLLDQQPMTGFYPQSQIMQAQPMQGTMPIRHDPMDSNMADGGIAAFRYSPEASQAYGSPVGYGYAAGGQTEHGAEGLLNGPGDGQSDGIAGLIEGQQGTEPVRLADGEFVIPADVVAALGSGSTQAGATALYALLDRVRQQAYGHTNQANPVNPADVLPA